MPRVSRPETKARRSAELEMRRAGVLDAAEQTFRTRGYPATKIDDIAESAGISIGTVYNFFGSKEGLYGAVIERIADDLVTRAKDLVDRARDAEHAIEALVRFRFSNYETHHLFFVLFSCERSSGIYPDPEAISENVPSLYYRYLDLVARTFERGMEEGAFERIHPLHLALSLEGVIGAFAGYWSRPDRTESLDAQARNVRDTFMRMAGLKRADSAPARQRPDAGKDDREVYITRFDLERLKELIAVARGFGSSEDACHLNELDRGLSAGRIVDSRSVPGDVVTMNSRVRLKNMKTGRKEVRSLVFPVDGGKQAENVSVLQPLGTALFGSRVGSLLAVETDGSTAEYLIEELLYQPESAGDYHL
jgi:regulator of nucleoside diphosphate kinase